MKQMGLVGESPQYDVQQMEVDVWNYESSTSQSGYQSRETLKQVAVVVTSGQSGWFLLQPSTPDEVEW